MAYIQSRTTSDGEEGIRVAKTINRPCTLEIFPLVDSGPKIKSVEMLHHFNNELNMEISNLISCFQSIWGNKFLASFHNEHSKELFMDIFSQNFTVNGQDFTADHALPLEWENQKNTIDILLFGAPYELKPEYIKNKLNKYVEIERLKYGKYSDFPEIDSGVITVVATRIKEDIPRKTRVNKSP